MSLLDRIIDRLHALFYSPNRSLSLGSRLVAVAVAVLTVTTVFPTVAEEIASSQEVVAEVPSPEASPTEEPSIAPASSEPTASPEPSPSATPETSATDSEVEEEVKVKAVKLQPRISFRFPNSVAVDPRASVANLPQLSIAGGGVGLLCLSSNGIIDIASKNIANNDNEGSLLVVGDLSSHVRISGNLTAINGLVNSGGGVRVTSLQGRVIKSYFSAGYVELTGTDLSAEFCSQASSHRSISFRALGLQMDNVKTRVDFNKPSGK